MNNHALKLIQKIQRFDDYFLDVIECAPMSINELETLILLRHKATGLKFKLKGILEETLSEFQLARFFRDISLYAKGNPGVALHTWISQIERIHDGTLEITSPSTPDLTPISEMPIEWIVLVVQCLLHKTLSTPKLKRIMQWEDQPIQRCLDVLKRTGILEERSEDLWCLNPYFTPFLVHQFKVMGIL